MDPSSVFFSHFDLVFVCFRFQSQWSACDLSRTSEHQNTVYTDDRVFGVGVRSQLEGILPFPTRTASTVSEC